MEGLKAYAQKRKEITSKKVDEAIKRLIKANKNVNFNSVSMESGITKATLYNNNNFRDRIETLRKQQELPSKGQLKRTMTDASKDILIAAKNKRIKELEKEIEGLKYELAKLRGKIYDNL